MKTTIIKKAYSHVNNILGEIIDKYQTTPHGTSLEMRSPECWCKKGGDK